jgi:hypothetical protein
MGGLYPVPRDDFKKPVRSAVAQRVALRCSNPNCEKLTSGPSADPARALNIGVAAHITAASPGGPRFDGVLTSEERSGIDNAIWLCQNCAALIDRDDIRFTVELLRSWKLRAERAAATALSAGSAFRPIAATETRQELSVGELLVVRELGEEFACHVETGVAVPTTDGGWLNLHGAVVRGEDLVAIDIRESEGRGIACFQIDYLTELGRKLSFQRFRRFVLYVAVVSSGPEESDGDVRQRLDSIVAQAGFEMHIRMYRLNALRAKYGV